MPSSPSRTPARRFHPRRSRVSSNPSNDWTRPHPPRRRPRTRTVGRPSDRQRPPCRWRPRTTQRRTHHRSFVPAGNRRQVRADARHRPDETPQPACQPPRLTLMQEAEQPWRCGENPALRTKQVSDGAHPRTSCSPAGGLCLSGGSEVSAERFADQLGGGGSLGLCAVE